MEYKKSWLIIGSMMRRERFATPTMPQSPPAAAMASAVFTAACARWNCPIPKWTMPVASGAEAPMRRSNGALERFRLAIVFTYLVVAGAE